MPSLACPYADFIFRLPWLNCKHVASGVHVLAILFFIPVEKMTWNHLVIITHIPCNCPP